MAVRRLAHGALPVKIGSAADCSLPTRARLQQPDILHTVAAQRWMRVHCTADADDLAWNRVVRCCNRDPCALNVMPRSHGGDAGLA